MKYVLLSLFALALAVTSSSHAGVISRDWKTPGDGLLTYDDVNQREWLDLTESRLTMFPGSTVEQRYQNALLELGPGGIFEGFTAGKSNDLLLLAQSAGVDTTTNNIAVNEMPIRNLIRLVGATVDNPFDGSVHSVGLLNETNDPHSSFGIRLIGHVRVIPLSGLGDASVYISPGAEPFQGPGLGAWLYRPVPEPGTQITTILFAWILMQRHRRRGPLACRQ